MVVTSPTKKYSKVMNYNQPTDVVMTWSSMVNTMIRRWVKILENINTVWDDTFYSAVVYGLDGEVVGQFLSGIHLDKPQGTKLEILEELSYMGLEIPEHILKPRK